MDVIGIHATGVGIADLISRSAFLPGRSLSNYLGGGTYFYLVHGAHGYSSATSWSVRVASRQYKEVSCLAALIDVGSALNLQHPVIQPLLNQFNGVLERRLKQIGIHVDANDDRSYFRPGSCIKLEAFRHFLEELSGEDIDVVAAQFLLRNRDIDQHLPHEICVKRSRAIRRVESAQSLVNPDAWPSSDPVAWPCSQKIIDAAGEAVRLVDAIADRDLLDLTMTVMQGVGLSWEQPRPRFAPHKPIHLLFDARDSARSEEILDALHLAAAEERRTIEALDFASLSQIATADGQRRVQTMMEQSTGIVAVLPPNSAEVVSLIVTIAERRPDVPVLVLLRSGRDRDILSEVRPPILLRSRQNICCVTPAHPDRVAELLAGFLQGRWADGLRVLDFETKMAARCGKPDVRRKDARRIVRALHARHHGIS